MTSSRHAVCAHCGLPARGGYQADGLSFCCYGCYLVRRIMRAEGDEGPATFVLARLGISIFLSMNVMMVSLALYTRAADDMGPAALMAFRWGLLGLSTPVLILLGTPFIRSAILDLRAGRLAMDALVAIGCLATYGVSGVNVVRGEGDIYFDTATMLLVLVTLGKFLEASAKTRTAASIRGLLALGDDRAVLVRDGGREDVPVAQVVPGDIVEVVPGARVPVDGHVVEGRSAVSESTFTGEPEPRLVCEGEAVYGGSLNGDGRLLVRAEGVGEDALLGRMARFVEEAQQSRAPSERRADRVSAAFIPFVCFVAAGAAVYAKATGGGAAQAGASALAVLVVACPCALGLATPLATCTAIGVAARSGVLIRSGEALERLPALTHLFFDKTGTLTRGAMEVTRIEVLDRTVGADELLAVAASLEAAGGHVIGRAIVRAAEGRTLPLGTAAGVRLVPGRGIVGTVALSGKERRVVVGDGSLLHDEGIGGTTGGAPSGATRVFVAWEGRLRGALHLTDGLRPEARKVVAALSRRGIRLTICSGDREDVTARVAEHLGLTDCHAHCTPETKPKLIRQAQADGAVVGMVGDGVNDAPALAVADIGFAMSGGSDLAKESSDITLLGDDLTRLPWLMELARATRRTVDQNLAWAFGYNAVAIAIAFLGYLHPLVAAIAMLGSSLMVTWNSLRLYRVAGAGRSPCPRVS